MTASCAVIQFPSGTFPHSQFEPLSIRHFDHNVERGLIVGILHRLRQVRNLRS